MEIFDCIQKLKDRIDGLKDGSYSIEGLENKKWTQKEIAEEFGKYLGHAMANLAAVADPSAIVIGGGVSKAGEVLLQYVEKNFKEKAFFANKDTEFVLATLGNDAGICGAAKLIL